METSNCIFTSMIQSVGDYTSFSFTYFNCTNGCFFQNETLAKTSFAFPPMTYFRQISSYPDCKRKLIYFLGNQINVEVLRSIIHSVHSTKKLSKSLNSLGFEAQKFVYRILNHFKLISCYQYSKC